MSYQVIARKWRPQTFEEVVGQEHVATTLKNAIQTGRIGHAYLFTGIRGVGKTTAARILAKALNCERGPTTEPCNQCRPCIEITQGISMDVREIDGASNRGIDSVRDLREGVAFAPARDRYKVYIIDEVHMLTQEAFNALLKTLEEPPGHVVFIFATTEAHKVPLTIVSRCQVFEFRRIPVDLLVERLRLIAEREGFWVSEDALRLIAREADGSLRDASSFLDQVASFSDGRVGVEQVTEVLRTGNRAAALEVLQSVLSNDAGGAMRAFLRASACGVPPRQFLRDVSRLLSDAIKVRLLGDDAVRETGLTSAEVSEMNVLVGGSPLEYLAALLHLFVSAVDQAADSRVPEMVVQAVLLRAAEMRSLADVRDLVARIEALAQGNPGGLGRLQVGPSLEGPPVVSPQGLEKARERPLSKEGRGATKDSASSRDKERTKPALPASRGAAVALGGVDRATRIPAGFAGQNLGAGQEQGQANSTSLASQSQIFERFRKHPVVDKVLKVFGAQVLDVKEEK